MVINEEVSVIDLRDVLKEIIKQCEIAKKLSNLNSVLQQITFIEHLANQEMTKLNLYDFSKRIHAKNIGELLAEALKSEIKAGPIGLKKRENLPKAVVKLIKKAELLKNEVNDENT
jgi:hypothetical protein